MVSTKQKPASTETPSPRITETTTEDDQSIEISKDELFHVLQNERRRRVLTYLLDREGPFEMRSIAEQVAAWEHDTTVRQLMSDERQRVYIALYQSHLPKLDEVGLIDYEQNRGVVEPTPLLETVSQYVDPPEEESEADDESTVDVPAADDRVDEADEELTVENENVYMGVTAISALLTGGTWTGALPVSGIGLAVAITGLFALTTVTLSRTE